MVSNHPTARRNRYLSERSLRNPQVPAPATRGMWLNTARRFTRCCLAAVCWYCSFMVLLLVGYHFAWVNQVREAMWQVFGLPEDPYSFWSMELPWWLVGTAISMPPTVLGAVVLDGREISA